MRVHAEAITPVPSARGEPTTLTVLGDSIAVGIGDPVRGGAWRGFAPLLAAAMDVRLTNVATSGARVADVRDQQLPLALREEPDLAVVIVGMNDTMRSDFDAERMHADLDRVLSSLTAAGAAVVTIRYHDHGRVFRLPGPLRRLLAARIAELNSALEAAAHRNGSGIVDLDRLPGAYHPSIWSVDRLHPCELGHRLLAHAFARQFAEAGVTVSGEVSLQCSGGVRVRRLDHLGWLVFKGIPWLLSRGRDLLPHLLRTLLRPSGVPESIAPPQQNRSIG
ncbi:SGNH/GDSL hydrolase family protein [Saccharopolyspora erythraea]|uniref:SGNH/GDSL hydrolase family protein n=1 Tax=Saccharopolyspora erythraea TaxID=1836 RepID=UPI001BADA9A9|nr:SGNH/GDSL hydrolase family protein [Saccharopolyspora erythraea]